MRNVLHRVEKVDIKNTVSGDGFNLFQPIPGEKTTFISHLKKSLPKNSDKVALNLFDIFVVSDVPKKKDMNGPDINMR